MRVVVNANILVAALLKSATTRQILLMSGLEFCAPEHLFVEVKDLVKDYRFRKRLGLTEEDLAGGPPRSRDPCGELACPPRCILAEEGSSPPQTVGWAMPTANKRSLARSVTPWAL